MSGEMHAREAALLSHYNGHPNYWSPLKNHSILRLAQRVDGVVAPPLLDVGCGDGRLAQQVDYPVVGVDMSDVRIDIARAGHPESEWHCADIYDWLTACERRFQTIVFVEVLEHLEQPLEAIQLAHALLADGGMIIGTAPLRMPYLAHLQVYQDLQDVSARLKPVHLVQLGRLAICRWENDDHRPS